MENGKKKNILIGVLIVLIFLLIGFICYDKLLKNDNSMKEEKININYEILNYQCKGKYCNNEDYNYVKQLLKTNDIVNRLYSDKNHKTHAVVLKNIDNGNEYLYLVNEDKYYFKNDNYYKILFINGNYEYDYDYAIIRQKITKHLENGERYETSNSKIYSFKNKKYVVEIDGYYDCSYVEYENQRFYKLSGSGEDALYDSKFNKIIDGVIYNSVALDDKYIFGIIEENSKYRFFRYNITDGKYKLSDVGFVASSGGTYNYVLKDNNGEYEIYDFDGNSIFKTNEELYLKDIKVNEYMLPCYPQLYYSKTENKIKLIIEPDLCGDETCPGKFLISYYEYDIESKSIMHKFFTNSIPDDIYQNLFDGYVEFNS